MLAHHAMDGLAALVVGHIGDRTGVDQADVSLLSFACCDNAHLLKHAPEGGGLREIQFAP